MVQRGVWQRSRLRGWFSSLADWWPSRWWAAGLGYGVGGNTVVRCREGHLFTTIWIPGASLKALRLGWGRLQYCRVGRHWGIVTPVRAADLTEAERQEAAEHHDIRIP